MRLLALLSVVGLMGCSNTLVTRREVVDARPLTPDARTRVVRIEGERATIVRTYRDGDALAGGGVVRVEPSRRLLAVGTSVLLGGAALVVSGVVLFSSAPPDTDTWCDGLFEWYRCTITPWQRTAGEIVAVAGGFVSVAGLVLTIASRVPRAHIHKAQAWSVAPGAGRTNLGATLSLSF